MKTYASLTTGYVQKVLDSHGMTMSKDEKSKHLTSDNHESTSTSTPGIDNNKSFKYIRDHLTSKHLEFSRRPNFNIALIAPIIQSDFQTPKHVDEKNFPARERSNALKATFKSKVSSRRNYDKPTSSTLTSAEYSILKSTMELNESYTININNAIRLNHRLNNNNSNPNANKGLIKSNDPTPNEEYTNVISAKSNDTSRSKDSAHQQLISSSYGRLEEFYQKMPSLSPKPKTGTPTFGPNFYLNYRQSGANITEFDKIKMNKSFKVNVIAPKNWLKLKYKPMQAGGSTSKTTVSDN